MIKVKLLNLLILLVLCSIATSSILESSVNKTCQICTKCTNCAQQIKKDVLIDNLHNILLQNFSPKLITYPIQIKKLQLSPNDLQYGFIYNTGLSIILRVNSKTGQVEILKHQDKSDSNQQSQSLSPSNPSNNNSLTNDNKISPLNIFYSVSNFFQSIKQIQISSATTLPVLHNLILKKYFLTELFKNVTSFAGNQIKTTNLKLIYFRSYSIKYYRLVYVFFNDNISKSSNTSSIISNNESLQVYQFVICQSDTGYSLIQNIRINQFDLSWINMSSVSLSSVNSSLSNTQSKINSNTISLIGLYLKNQKLIDSQRFDIKTINMNFFLPKTNNLNPQMTSNTSSSLSLKTTNQILLSNVASSSLSTQTISYEYQQIPNFKLNKQVNDIEKFLEQYFYLTYKRLSLRKVEKQYIFKNRSDQISSFRFTFRVVKYGQSQTNKLQPLHYQIVITKYIKQLTNQTKYEILNANYLNILPLYQIKQLLDQSTLTEQQVTQDGNLPYIDSIVLKQFTQQLNKDAPIIKIKRHQPYYQLTYIDSLKREIKITVIYQMVMNTIEFYVEGKNSLASNSYVNSNTNNSGQEYKYLTDSGKRSQGSIVQNNNNITYSSAVKTNSASTNFNILSNVTITNSTNSAVKNQTITSTSSTSVNNKTATQNINSSSSAVAGASVSTISNSKTSNVSATTSTSTNSTIKSPTSSTTSASILYSNFQQLVQIHKRSNQYSSLQFLTQNLSNSSPQITKIIEFLITKYGQGINNFMKLIEVQKALNSNNGAKNKLVQSIYRLIFQIKRYESLSAQAVKFINTNALRYEIVCSYTVQNQTKNSSTPLNANANHSNQTSTKIQIFSSGYLSDYCYIPTTIPITSIINQFYLVMSFDSSKLLNDLFYININQLLLSSQITPNQSISSAIIVKQLVKGAYVRKVGRLLPFYLIQYSNGLVFVVWYEVLEKKIVVNAIINNGSFSGLILTAVNRTSQTNQSRSNVNTNPKNTFAQNVSKANSSQATNNNRTTQIKNTTTITQTNTTAKPSITSNNQSLSTNTLIRQPVLIKQIKEDITIVNTTGLNTQNQTSSQNNVLSLQQQKNQTEKNFQNSNNKTQSNNNLVQVKQQITVYNTPLVQVKEDTSFSSQPVKQSSLPITSKTQDKINNTNNNSMNNSNGNNTKINSQQKFLHPIVIIDQVNDLKPQQIEVSSSTQSFGNVLQNKKNQSLHNNQSTQSSQSTVKQPTPVNILNRNNSTNKSSSSTSSNSEQPIQKSPLISLTFTTSSTTQTNNNIKSLVQSLFSTSNTQKQRKVQKLQNIILTTKLIQYQQLPNVMYNDFMSPFYLIFKHDYILYRRNSTKESGAQILNSPNTNIDNNPTLLFDFNKVKEIIMIEYGLRFNKDIKFSSSGNIIVDEKVNFQIVISHKVYDSAYRLIIYAPQIRKVFEIIFLSFNYYVLSFKQISTLKQITLSLNQNQYLIYTSSPIVQKSTSSSSSSSKNTIQEFQLLKSYQMAIKMLLLQMQLLQIKEVKILLVPEGIEVEISYIGRRSAITASTNNVNNIRNNNVKEWFVTKFVYEIEIQAFSLIKHEVYVPGGDYYDKNVMLFSNVKNQKISSLVNTIGNEKLNKARDLAKVQTQLIIKQSSKTSNQTTKLVSTSSIQLIQIYQLPNQSNNKNQAYIITKLSSNNLPSISLLFKYNFLEQKVISVQSIQLENSLFILKKSYNKKSQANEDLNEIEKDVIRRSKQYSSLMFKNQLMEGENQVEMIAGRKLGKGDNVANKDRQVHYYKVYFNQPLLYHISLKVIIQSTTPSSTFKTQIIGIKRLTQKITSVDQYFDETDSRFIAYTNIDTQQIKSDQIYQFLYQQTAIKKYPELASTAILLGIYKKQTVQQVLYNVIFDIRTKTNILHMKYSKFNNTANTSNNVNFLSANQTSINVNGFYKKYCLRQSNKGYCMICKNQFISGEYQLSNGRCFGKISKCKAQLAYVCYVCQPGFILYENTCVVSSTANIAFNDVSSEGNGINSSQANNNNSQRNKAKICLTFDNKGKCVQCRDEQAQTLVEATCIERNLLSQNKNRQLLAQQYNITSQQAQLFNSDLYCRRWTSKICIDCIKGTVMTSSRKCQITKQNCLSYNYAQKRCDNCFKDFTRRNGRCLR